MCSQCSIILPCHVRNRTARPTCLSRIFQDYLERPVDASPGLDVEGFNELLLGSAYLDAANAVLVRLRGTMAAAEEYARGFEEVKWVPGHVHGAFG